MDTRDIVGWVEARNPTKEHDQPFRNLDDNAALAIIHAPAYLRINAAKF
jgi:hypothetical protein